MLRPVRFVLESYVLRLVRTVNSYNAVRIELRKLDLAARWYSMVEQLARRA